MLKNINKARKETCVPERLQTSSLSAPRRGRETVVRKRGKEEERPVHINTGHRVVRKMAHEYQETQH